MTALWVLGIILGCLLLISLIRVGGRVQYDENGLLVRLRVGVFSFTVYPMKPKKKKPPKEEPKAETQEPKEAPPRGGGLGLVMDMLPVIAETAGRLRRKISIDDLELDLLWSHPDPAVCGMGYGAANGAIGMIWPLLEQNFHIRKYRIHTGVDFDRGSPAFRAVGALSLTIGQGVSMGLRLLFQFLQVYRRHRPAAQTTTTKKKEAV